MMDILVWLFLLSRKLRYKQKQTAKERKCLCVSADGGGEGTRDETHGFQNRTDRILNSYL